MNDEAVWAAIVGAIREEVGDPSLVLAPEMTALDVPGWDSLAHVRILLNIDVRLSVLIDIDATYRAATIGDLIAILRQSPPSG